MREMKSIESYNSLPSNWQLIRNKALFIEINEKCSEDDKYELLSVSEYYGVAPKKEKIGESDILVRADSLEGYKICQPNDIVMNIMLAWKKAQGVSDYEGIVSPAYCIYRKKENAPVNMRYIHYLIRTDEYASLYKRYSTGIIDSRLRLYPDKFLSLYSHVPPLEEQQKIATCLDTQCSKVDTLIANQQSQIEKLKSYKQSLITEVVTKGLDKNVPMKDSGVEWIGEIPCDWQISKVRYIGTLQNGLSKGGEYFGEGYPFVSYGDIYKNYELPENVYGLVKTDEKERENYSVKQGDIFFTRTSETIEEVGFSCVCKKTIENATFAGFVIRLRPYKKDDIILTEYAKYYFRGTQIRAYLIKEMNLVTRASLGQTLLKSMSVTVPPLDEQKRISEHLDTKCLQIDNLISIKQQKIEKLQQYKKSLIYEYVTGKKEVK